jgi:hypothetical protein
MIPQFTKQYSQPLKDAVLFMLNFDPNSRATIDQVISLPFFPKI